MSTETIVIAATPEAIAPVVEAAATTVADSAPTIVEQVTEAVENTNDITGKIIIGAGVLAGIGLGYLGYRVLKNRAVNKAASAPADAHAVEPGAAHAAPTAQAEKAHAEEPVRPATVRPVDEGNQASA